MHAGAEEEPSWYCTYTHTCITEKWTQNKKGPQKKEKSTHTRAALRKIGVREVRCRIDLPQVHAEFDRRNQVYRLIGTHSPVEWHHERAARHWCHPLPKRSTVAYRVSWETRTISSLLPWRRRSYSPHINREYVDECRAVRCTNDPNSCR